MTPLGLTDNVVHISVVIPVRNADRYLRTAIDSVLVQTLPPSEVLVIDDGSTDGSLSVASAYGKRVHVLTGTHGGIGAARNAGVERASGDFLAFLDADDYWVPEKLAWQVDVFRRFPDVELVFGLVRQFYSPDLVVAAEERARMDQLVYPGHHAGTMLIRREAFRRVGLFDTSVRIGEFLDWCARAREADVRTEVLPKVVMFRRIHSQNTVTRHRASQTDYARILKATLDRRRASEAAQRAGTEPRDG